MRTTTLMLWQKARLTSTTPMRELMIVLLLWLLVVQVSRQCTMMSMDPLPCQLTLVSLILTMLLKVAATDISLRREREMLLLMELVSSMMAVALFLSLRAISILITSQKDQPISSLLTPALAVHSVLLATSVTMLLLVSSPLRSALMLR